MEGCSNQKPLLASILPKRAVLWYKLPYQTVAWGNEMNRLAKNILIVALVGSILLVQPNGLNKAEASPSLIVRLLVVAGLRKKTAQNIQRAITVIRVANHLSRIEQPQEDVGFWGKIDNWLKSTREAYGKIEILGPILRSDNLISTLVELTTDRVGPGEIRVIQGHVEVAIATLEGRVKADECGPVRAFGHADGSISIAYCVNNKLDVAQDEQFKLLHEARELLRNQTETVAANLCAPPGREVFSEAYTDRNAARGPCDGISQSYIWDAKLIVVGQNLKAAYSEREQKPKDPGYRKLNPPY